MANPPTKDTIYIDVDDEITAIIDKLRASQARIVALVLPKRATVLQSVVNMKLLKRSAEQSKKQLVLITSEASLLPLAGSIGLHVADSLQSKPQIPASPTLVGQQAGEEESLSLEDEPEPEYTADNAGNKPVGELAKKSGSGLLVTSGVETEGPSAGAAATNVASKEAAAKPAKPNKKLRVPNFNKFRVKLIIIGLLLLGLAIFIYLAIFVLPKATIAIGTNAEDINSSLDVQLDTTASEVDLASSTVPASAVQQQKTYSEQVDATGEENRGNTATGTIVMAAASCVPDLSPPDTVGRGTGVSTGGKTYITQEDATFSYSSNDSSCVYYKSNEVAITAQDPGADYNMPDGTDFSVNSSSSSDVSATGSASGGTDNIVQVVTQSDIDNAKGKIEAKDDEVRESLHQQLLQNNLFPMPATFQSSKPNISSSSQPGDEAKTVTVTASITYTMLGTDRDNLVALIRDDVAKQVDIERQAIIDDGLDKASFSLQDRSDAGASVGLENTATVGPEIDLDSLKQQVAGQKNGDAKDVISQIPGVEDVTIELSPFWVTRIPDNPDKIIIDVGKTAAQN